MSKEDCKEKDHRRTVGEWLSEDVVWRIPVYQRHYAWDSEADSSPIHLFWETVEKQTVKRLNRKPPHQHYLGAVLVDNRTGGMPGYHLYDVVDGQQRLTTIQIALLALLRVIDDNEMWGDDKWRSNIKTKLEKYVFSDKEKNEPRLFPTNFDQKQFKGILFDIYGILIKVGKQNSSKDNAGKSKIEAAYNFFQRKYVDLVCENSSHSQEETVDAIIKTLTEGFDIVLIILRKDDKAQLIFESLNNYAKPLTTFDLIRNYVFYRAGKDKDVELFNTNEWQDLEDPYWEEKADKGNTHIEAYVAKMLVAKMTKMKKEKFIQNNIFKTYKEFSNNYSSIDDEIESLISYVDIYRSLDLAKKQNPDFAEPYFGVFYHKIWEKRDFYPVIFSIQGSGISDKEKRKMLRLLESYVIRRSICGLSTKHYNLSAMNICSTLGDTPTYAAMHDMLMKPDGSSIVFPSDESVIGGCFKENFSKNKLPFQRYMFKKIEKFISKDNVETIVVPDGSLTIDHILPQKWDANEEWERILLGDYSPNEQDIKKGEINTSMNTIGNLTMMSGANNSSKSNNSFDDFNELLRNSSMTMNRNLAKSIDEKGWDIEIIGERSKELADIICELWPYGIE